MTRAFTLLALFLALPSWALTFSVDPATSIDVVHRKDANGSVIVLADNAATVAASASTSATAKNVTVSADGKLNIVRCQTPCVGKVVVQVDKNATVTVASPAATPPVIAPLPVASDFDARKSAPGVVRWFDFDDAAKLVGPRLPSGAIAYGVEAGESAPVVDTAVSASGAGSLRFDVKSQTGANAAGDFRAEFSDDLSVQFGENSQFYVQWRQRFNQAMVDTLFMENAATGQQQEGIKQVIVTAGDTPTRTLASCEAIGVVVSSYYQRRFPIAYDSCTGSGTHGPYAGMYEAVAGGDYRLQNGTTPYCMYAQAASATPSSDLSGCFAWAANEWMTFEVRVKTGPRNAATHEFDQSEFQLWAARENGAPVLIVDWHPGVGAYFALTADDTGFVPALQESFGKVYLLPYMTRQDATQVHPLAQTWYDELIVSRNPINFPGGKPLTVPRT